MTVGESAHAEPRVERGRDLQLRVRHVEILRRDGVTELDPLGGDNTVGDCEHRQSEREQARLLDVRLAMAVNVQAWTPNG